LNGNINGRHAAKAGSPLRSQNLGCPVADADTGDFGCRDCGCARKEHWDSARGAYATHKSLRVDKLRVLLLDDVLTTGATLDSCARALKPAGAGIDGGASRARLVAHGSPAAAAARIGFKPEKPTGCDEHPGKLGKPVERRKGGANGNATQAWLTAAARNRAGRSRGGFCRPGKTGCEPSFRDAGARAGVERDL